MTVLFSILVVGFLGWSSPCPKEKIIEDEYIITGVISQSLQKTRESEWALTAISSNANGKSNNKKSNVSLKTNDDLQKTFHLKTKNLEAFKAAHPQAQIQNDCAVEIFDFNDPLIDELYTYQNWYFDALSVFNIEDTNTHKPIVAVIDSSFNLEHEDLQTNIWINQKEALGRPGQDDDGNGFVDDINGYDVADNDNNVMPSYSDTEADIDHGTHVLGLIGADSYNRTGVRGLAQNRVQVMTVKAFRSNSTSKLSDFLKAIYYAVDNGARVINASWGVEKSVEQAEIDAINYALKNDVLIIAAAGNASKNVSTIVPANIDNVYSVASLNAQQNLSFFSNYGVEIDFVAPGGGFTNPATLLSTGFSSTYLGLKGTSMSAPLVTALIGTLLSLRPEVSPYQIAEALKLNSDKLSLSSYDSSVPINYNKPNFNRTWSYLNTTVNLPNYNRIPASFDGVSSFKANASSSGGCSRVLSNQDSSSDYLESKPNLLLLIIVVFSFYLGIRRRIRK